MTCQGCGRESENGVPTHYLGCMDAAKPQVTERDLQDGGRAPEGQCAKDGCTNPRAVSKGPRPAKYCTDHKANRSR